MTTAGPVKRGSGMLANEPVPCNHQWIASKFEITGANSAFATEWKITHVKCVNCREEREL